MGRTAVLLLLLASAAAAQETAPLVREFLAQERRAFDHFAREDYEEAVAAFERQIALFSENPRPYYNIACCYALLGDAERAATWLSLSISHGWRDEDHLQNDPDFDGIRKSAAFRVCREQLRRTIERDPPPLPRHVSPDSVALVDSLELLRVTFAAQDRRLQAVAPLYMERQLRERLFRSWDHRIAALTRFLRAHGDARRADEAAYLRVQIAARYLDRADPRDPADARLRRVAARRVLAAAESFLRNWPQSPLLSQVRFLRAWAGARGGARRPDVKLRLREIVEDHPDDLVGARALVELCRYEAEEGAGPSLREHWSLLRRRWEGDDLVERLTRSELWAARLLVEGTGGAPLERPEARHVLHLFVSTQLDRAETERWIRTARAIARRRSPARFAAVVYAVDPPGSVAPEDVRSWGEEHAADLRFVPDGLGPARALGLVETPTVLLTEGSDVLLVNPTPARLKKRLAATR